MNEQLAVYLWSISENVQFTMIMLGLITLIAGITYTAMTYDGESKLGLALSIMLLIFGLVNLTGAGLIPDKNDLAIITAVPYAKQAIQSKQMSQINEASTLYLDKLIKDLKK